MDTIGIQRSVQQIWSVDENGDGAELLSEIVGYGCIAHGMGFSGWGGVVDHCRSAHSPEGAASANGQSDATDVSTFHSVELESPGE